MSVETLTYSHNPNAFTEQMHGDVEERTRLLEVADILAAMEAQFQGAEPDEKTQLLALKESLITELTAENPGHTLLNEVILLASVYQKRVAETTLSQDGSRVKAFGTRDKHNLYLAETYVLHEKPDGGYHYLIQRRSEAGVFIYELDDQADLRITLQADRTKLLMSQPHQLSAGTDDYGDAVRKLLGTTLTAMGAIRERDTQTRAKADRHALFLIEESPFTGQFLHAESSNEVMRRIESLMVVKSHVVHTDPLSINAMLTVIARRSNS